VGGKHRQEGTQQFIIHHSPFPPATALPSPCSRILNPRSCPTPRSILAYFTRFVKRHRVPFGPPREAFPRSMDGLPPPGRVPLVCFGGRLARSPARERVKKPVALTTEAPRHREKALSFQFPLPWCLCGEKFVSEFFYIFRRPCYSGQSAPGLCVRDALKSRSGARRPLLWHGVTAGAWFDRRV
jgi:hypothetical protein